MSGAALCRTAFPCRHFLDNVHKWEYNNTWQKNKHNKEDLPVKKRIISFLLALTMLIGMMPVMATEAEAATQCSYVPNAMIEYSYVSTVSPGTIRYISQNPGSNYFNSQYWPSSSFGGYSTPTIECGTACISMALSYIGVNQTPKAMLEAKNGYTYFDGWSGATYSSLGVSEQSISDAIDKYINGNGKYSPPVIQIKPFSSTSNQHYVVLIGKVANNQYCVLDPYSDSTWTVTISGTSAKYHNGTNPITQVHQWYNADASIKNTHIDVDYRTYGLLEVTAGTTYVKSMPCSEKPVQVTCTWPSEW